MAIGRYPGIVNPLLQSSRPHSDYKSFLQHARWSSFESRSLTRRQEFVSMLTVVVSSNGATRGERVLASAGSALGTLSQDRSSFPCRTMGTKDPAKVVLSDERWHAERYREAKSLEIATAETKL